MSKIFEIKTIQSSAIKCMIEALKELLTDTVLEINDTGIKIVTMDNAHVILVHLKLHADKFEYYECKKPISIGIEPESSFSAIIFLIEGKLKGIVIRSILLIICVLKYTVRVVKQKTAAYTDKVP